MGKIGTVFFASALALLTSVGCGSGSDAPAGGSGSGGGAAPNFDALQATLTTPTGTLTPGGEGAVISKYSAQNDASARGNLFGGGSSSSSGGKTTGQSHAEGIALDTVHALSGCDSLKGGGTGTCSCESGDIAYDIPANASEALGGKSDTPVDVVMSIKANSCVQSGKSLNGSLYIKIKRTDAKNQAIIYSIHIAIKDGKNDGQYDVDLMYETKAGLFKIVYAVDVPDGKVLVSGNWDANTQMGMLTIQDKVGTTTCTSTGAGTGKCTGPDGKERTDVRLHL